MLCVIENTHKQPTRDKGPNGGEVLPYLAALDDDGVLRPIAMSRSLAEELFGPLWKVGSLGTPVPAPGGLTVVTWPDNRPGDHPDDPEPAEVVRTPEAA